MTYGSAQSYLSPITSIFANIHTFPKNMAPGGSSISILIWEVNQKPVSASHPKNWISTITIISSVPLSEHCAGSLAFADQGEWNRVVERG